MTYLGSYPHRTPPAGRRAAARGAAAGRPTQFEARVPRVAGGDPGLGRAVVARAPAGQIVSGTFVMAPHGHSAMQMPQPLQ